MKVLLIFLGILKWIGIVLLALLLLLLLLILVVLFSPIRYRLAGEKGGEVSGSFGVSWFWGLVRCDGTYTQKDSLQMRLKVLWITLIGGEPKEKKKRKKRGKKAAEGREATTDPVELSAAEKITPPPREKMPAAEQKKELPDRNQESPKKQESSEWKQRVKPQQMQKAQPKTVRRVKLSEIEEKPPLTEEGPLFSAEEEAFFTGETEEEKKRSIPPIVKELWHMDGKKEIFRALKKLLRRLMKGILPGNLFLKGTVGTGDPTTTGYILALAGILTAKFGNDIQIKGDFTKAVAEDIEIQVRGRIVLGRLLWAVLAFVLTKPVRRLLWRMVKELRKED